MKRGDIVIGAERGVLTTKPRPYLVVQSDAFEGGATVTVCPITGDTASFPLFRIRVDASSGNGLEKPSAIMVDKIHTLQSSSFDRIIGRLEDDLTIQVDDALQRWLDL
jgi:mRNA interferase MazF